MAVVEDLLNMLELGTMPVLTLFNKIDLVEDREQIRQLIGKDGLTVSALKAETFKEFLVQAERMIGKTLDSGGMTKK